MMVRLNDDMIAEMREDVARGLSGSVAEYDDDAVKIALDEIVDLRARVVELEKELAQEREDDDQRLIDVHQAGYRMGRESAVTDQLEVVK